MRKNFKISGKIILLLISMFYFSTKVKTQDTLTVMSYNLLNYGNITSYCTNANNSFADKEKPLHRIAAYIQPDIFGVVELGSNTFVHQRLLDSVLNNNIGKHYSKAAYSNQAGSYLVSMLYYNDQKLALKSQYVLNTLVRDIVMYRLYYLSPTLAQTQDTAFVNCIVSHLKAGSTSADEQSRADMTLNAMNWIQANGGAGNYLFMGDLNLKTSTEQAYQNLTNFSISILRFYDPINKPGSWYNTSSMADYHTQSTHVSSDGCASTGGMDDRFDFILASASIINGTNHYQYIPNSYHAVGNDGAHFNLAINSGTNTSVPVQIANDLYQMSDHLPVVLKLKTNQTGAGIKPSEKQNLNVIYPNPASKSLTIEFEHALEHTGTFILYDITGRKIKEYKLSVGLDTFVFDISTLQNGVYFYSLSSDRDVKGKVIINN